MPARAMMRMISGTHEFWYRLSGGLIGGRLDGRRFCCSPPPGVRAASSGRPPSSTYRTART